MSEKFVVLRLKDYAQRVQQLFKKGVERGDFSCSIWHVDPISRYVSDPPGDQWEVAAIVDGDDDMAPWYYIHEAEKQMFAVAQAFAEADKKRYDQDVIGHPLHLDSLGVFEYTANEQNERSGRTAIKNVKHRHCSR